MITSLYKEVLHEYVHRLFYPVVAMVITASFENETAAMLASSCMPLSLNPPVVGVAVMKTHRTYRIIKNSNQYAVCWLSLDKLDKLKKLAEKTPDNVRNKLSYVGFEIRKGRKLPDLPIPADAGAWIECKVIWSKPVGDHELFAAHVEAAYATEDFNEYWQYQRYKPTLYIGGKYTTIP